MHLERWASEIINAQTQAYGGGVQDFNVVWAPVITTKNPNK